MSGLPYRPNVGIMVLNRDNKVWIGHRLASKKSEYWKFENLWQMPQGGIDDGEDPEPAARRELQEETGIKTVTLLDQTPDWIKYDFPPDAAQSKIAQKYRGQKQMWFAYRFEGVESEIDIIPTDHKPEFDKWRWEDMANLPDLIVPFKRDVYLQVVETFKHLA